MLNITDVRISMSNTNTTLYKALASITLDGCFVVHDIRILEGDKGLFIAMPSHFSNRKHAFVDVAHPLNTDTREQISRTVLAAYRKHSLI